MQLKELIEFIAKAMVDDPDSVEVREVEAEQSSLIEIRVAKADMGKIIGRKGQNVTAMRTILNGVSAKMKKRVVLDVVE
ncbi:MAG: KH domain-containing protein [Proteobacteria bacterium]|nr:KH domain-containing protein [Pseudomonadota bacterium]